MDITRHATAADLLDAAGDFLAAHEAEHNVQLGILATLRDQPGYYREPPYLAVVRDGTRIALVVVRTPPYGPVLSLPGVPDDRLPAALDVLVGDLRSTTPTLPGVIGPPSCVVPFARRWSGMSGQPARLQLAERIYRLSRVVVPLAPAGSWRLAGEHDRDQLVAWLAAFHAEALPPGSVHSDHEQTVDLWIRSADRFAYLWESDGRPVSLVVAGSRTPTGRRIGPVYTPPEERGRGFASALTAAASADQLERGARYCFLLTDLSNPTANAIYQRIGYQPVSDVDLYAFGPAG
jgi:GNAT superfamily N-acetyltransferase